MDESKNETQKRFSVDEEQPSAWFEPLYSSANAAGDGVPWANMATHPSFAEWLRRNPQDGAGKRALVVGCGMGDDAIELESIGFQVTAFDVSDSAIGYCNERFPRSGVSFEQADLLHKQPQWRRKFDFVVEIFTIQALPPKFEKELVENISDFVAPGGQLLVIAEVSREARSFENGPPWVLTAQHVEAIASCGLTIRQQDVQRGAGNVGDDIYVTTFGRPGEDSLGR